MSCPSISPLLRFGGAEVLLPKSMATGLQNTFSLLNFFTFSFYTRDFSSSFLLRFYSPKNGAILNYDPYFLGLFHNESH